MHQTRNICSGFSRLAVFAVVTVLACGAVSNLTYAGPGTQKGQSKTEQDEPPFREYKGVKIGMNTDEARKILGKPTDKDDEQDFYVVSDTETAQIYYDKAHMVMAVSVSYVGEGSGVPKPSAVLGNEIKAKPDGSMHELIRFPKAGYWISYSRTAGNSPIVTVTLQKINK